MEKQVPTRLLPMPCQLRAAPLRVPGTPARLPPRDPFRESVRRDPAWGELAAGDCARRQPCPALPRGGALAPACLRQRNERERQRVRCVNAGYARLRDHLPAELARARLSKVETLRAAIGYIRQLQQLLERHGAARRRGADGSSDGESKASSAPSPCSEPEDSGS